MADGFVQDGGESAARLRFPVEGNLVLADLLAAVDPSRSGADGALTFGDERALSFLDDVSRRLLHRGVVSRFPELAPLGFFLRRSRLTRCLAAARPSDELLLVPRGPVFHVPPANVDALLLYPWALSLLAGNANVVRLSSRASGASDLLLDVLREAAEGAAPAVRASQFVVAYGRDDEITAALSEACRLRVLWGGDEAVDRLRRHPLAPDARDLTFADRCSLCAISADAWLRSPSAVLEAATEGFYNDAYWYGQSACASPLTVCWIGTPARTREAQEDFVKRLRACLGRRQPPGDAQAAVEQQVRTYGLAATGEAVSLRHHDTFLTSLSPAPGRVLDRWSGTGTFGFVSLPALPELAPLIGRRHQTLSHFGFAQDELMAFARTLGGRGVDRIVPMGEALGFEPVWDGYDLVREFSRSVTVRSPRPAPASSASR